MSSDGRKCAVVGQAVFRRDKRPRLLTQLLNPRDGNIGALSSARSSQSLANSFDINLTYFDCITRIIIIPVSGVMFAVDKRRIVVSRNIEPGLALSSKIYMVPIGTMAINLSAALYSIV